MASADYAAGPSRSHRQTSHLACSGDAATYPFTLPLYSAPSFRSRKLRFKSLSNGGAAAGNQLGFGRGSFRHRKKRDRAPVEYTHSTERSASPAHHLAETRSRVHRHLLRANCHCHWRSGASLRLGPGERCPALRKANHDAFAVENLPRSVGDLERPRPFTGASITS